MTISTMTSEELQNVVLFGAFAFAGLHRLCLAAERMFPATRFANGAQLADHYLQGLQSGMKTGTQMFDTIRSVLSNVKSAASSAPPVTPSASDFAASPAPSSVATEAPSAPVGA